jgi:hypothetical protein
MIVDSADFRWPPDSSKPSCCICGCNDELANLKPARASMIVGKEWRKFDVHLGMLKAGDG